MLLLFRAAVRIIYNECRHIRLSAICFYKMTLTTDFFATMLFTHRAGLKLLILTVCRFCCRKPPSSHENWRKDTFLVKFFSGYYRQQVSRAGYLHFLQHNMSDFLDDIIWPKNNKYHSNRMVLLLILRLALENMYSKLVQERTCFMLHL